VKNRAGLTDHKLRYAHDHAPVGDFLTAIQSLKPTAIIGVAAVGGAFTPEVLKTMAEINDRPIVFALSNPTSKAECSAEEAYRHTSGRALFARGSPYDPVRLDGKTFVPRQGNNSYIFPASVSARPRSVTLVHCDHGAAEARPLEKCRAQSTDTPVI
jgi:malate dehydrogenase (oxaloacetate-decarboxylating)(NADP+)